MLNLLAVLRFLLGSVLTFLLLGPVLKYTGFITQKPILAMVIDDSKSMIQGDVSKEQINTALGSLDKNLSEKYDVEWVAYSNVAQSTNISSLAYNGTETNYSQALRFVTDQYVNQNLGAVVLLSDGIFNAGTDPSYVAENYKVPIYTIGLGDTTVYVDCGVSNVSHNSIAYLGNEFPMQVELKASKLKGKQANLM